MPKKKPEFGEDWWNQSKPPSREELNKKISEEVTPTASAQEQAAETLKGLTDIESTFDLSKISDLDYLFDIFQETYDSYKSLGYLKRVREQLIRNGYPDTPLLNTMVFLSTIVRRLQIIYQHHHVLMRKHDDPRPEDLNLLKQIQEISKLLGELQKAMDLAVLRQKEAEDVFSLHENMMVLAEKEIQENIGEFTFRCQKCGTIINTEGLEFWAIRTEKGPDGYPVHFVFSPEIWECLKGGVIPLHIAAFILRTSIEGLLYTANQRKEAWQPEFTTQQIEVEEGKLAELMTTHENRIGHRQQEKFLDQSV